MAASFGIDPSILQSELIELIGLGYLKARIDSAAGTLVAKKKDARGEAFKNALKEGEKLQKKAIASQLR